MSLPEHGLNRPAAASRSTSSSSSAFAHNTPRPQSYAGGSQGHIVDVTEASRVLECAQVERQLRFQRIVRLYMSQIVHGCKSAYCVTPTCLSSQKRNASRPLRPPTELTARALAHYLAEQDDPQRGLCPHELKVDPKTLEIEGACKTGQQKSRDGDCSHSASPPSSSGADIYNQSRHRVDARDHAQGTSYRDAPRAQERVAAAIEQRRQARKDTKSLSQNLYDSVSMIYAYSKQLPSSASILHALRSSTASDADTQTKAQSSARPATSATPTNGDTVTPPLNMSAPIGRPHSQGSSHINTTPTTREVLDNGQQVHRIPYQHRDSNGSIKNGKATNRTSIADSRDSQDLSNPKIRKKSSLSDETSPVVERAAAHTLPQRKGQKNSGLSQLPRPLLPALSALNCSSLEGLKDNVYNRRKDRLPDNLNFSVDYDTNRHFQPSTPFVNRSLFFTLSDPDALLKSFHDTNHAFAKSPLPHLDSARLAHSFRDWNRHNGALIFDSLCLVLETFFVPPPELQVQKSPKLTPSRKGASIDHSTDRSENTASIAMTGRRYLSDTEAAHIVVICIHALTSSVSVGWPHTWVQLRKLRAWGIVLPNAAPETDEFTHPYLNIIDELEYEPAIRLAEHLLRAIGARTCFEHILDTMKKQQGQQDNQHCAGSLMNIVLGHLKTVERVALASRRRMTPNHDTGDDPGWTVTATLMEWLKTVITKKWDSKSRINKWSSVGTSILLLDKLYKSHQQLNLHKHMFEIPFFNERLDTVEEPVQFMSWEEQPNTFHILQYPALFPVEYLVKYFRTINFTGMMTQYNNTARVLQMQNLLERYLREPHNWLAKSHMKVTMTDYLTLNVSRRETLRDTFDQLWGVEKRTLLKPLKVKMGEVEGEVGLDHGGVTYEFFRVVLREAFKPDHGMFTLDPLTRMIWFQPGTLEPDWKFEMIGILFSLALYNGVTLPITFPLALYHFLLTAEPPFHHQSSGSEHLNFIKDGWPELAKGLETLLAWTEGDVSDVFVRDYAFSYEAYGQHIDHNMSEPYVRPNQGTSGSRPVRPEDLLNTPTTEAKPVTNANREAFVHDYVHHLTYLSVLPQLLAFRKGCLACLHPQSLQLFTPPALRNLIEGTQHISIPELRACTRYEQGYTSTHPTVLNFWRIVESYSQEDCRHLLEFVTASDRIPVTGYEGITFLVSRVGLVPGKPTLPSSSTCFGKLYLPNYESEEVLRQRLALAIRNSKGFGVY